jgi:prepilin-type N-terminal cleavage/methylation domain-containing protein
MNKKGFTFIELLAVIVLISVVLLIAVPSIRYADRKFHEKAYNTKMELILNAAKEYGDDFKEVIIYNTNGSSYSDPSTGSNYPAVTITVRDLLNNGYITKDNGLNETDILDPRDDSSMLNKSLTVYIKNNRAYAKFN